MAHVRVQQTWGDVPVWGGEAIVHLGRDATVFAITNHLVPDVAVDVFPGLTRDLAVTEAVARMDCSACDPEPNQELPTGLRRPSIAGCECLTAEPELDLWVLRHEGVNRLAWRVQLRREDGSDRTSMPVTFIDAHTGESCGVTTTCRPGRALPL